jgi:uncharacterized protein (TIGR02246 family)
MDFDLVVVGAGPAGLAAAIRLKQLAAAAERELSVLVLEKGSEVGAHILSGAVIDPIGLNSLIPDWKAKGAPVETPVSEDRFYYLGPAGALRIPNIVMPPLMGNHGNYIVSLGNLTRWLGEQAAEMGVEVFPGFAAAEVLYDEQAAVIGVATGEMGLSKDGKPTDRFTRGMPAGDRPWHWRLTMKLLLALVILAFGLTPVCADQAADEAAIREIQARWDDAWNRHDVQALSALVADDVRFVNVSGQILKSRAEFQQLQTRTHAMQFKESIRTVTGTEIKFLTPDIAIAHVSWGMRGDKNPESRIQTPPRGSLGMAS